MKYFLGIDAGATKTQCVLGSETDVLARVHGGSIKITRVEETRAKENLEEILAALVLQSGIALNSIAGICVGLSGIAIPSVTEWVRNALTSRMHCPVSLCGDEEIALDAAFHGGRGILAIAGTGSHVVGRTSAGELVRTGGWGPVVSDQGAGSRIGLLGVRAVFHTIDASEQTSLLPALHGAWNTSTVEELVEMGNRIPGPDFSVLAPMVARCAADGDRVARRVLEQSGEELADLILLAMKKAAALETVALAHEKSSSSTAWKIAFTGGVIEKISLLRDSAIAAILGAAPPTQFLAEPADPAMGALWRARERRFSFTQ